MNHYFKARQKGREKIEKEIDEFIDKLFSNAEIPKWANDVKPAIKYFIVAQRLSVIEDVRECALIKVRKIEFGNENSEDIKHNEIIMDFLAKLPSKEEVIKKVGKNFGNAIKRLGKT